LLVLSSVLLTMLFSACTFSRWIETTGAGQPSEVPGAFVATFLGQDGGSFAGRECSSGMTDDNVHIHLSGLRSNSEPVSFQVEDFAGGGNWATPCNPVSNWFLFVEPVVNQETDIYFKPFRDAPSGTEYQVTVVYEDGAMQATVVSGTRVKP